MLKLRPQLNVEDGMNVFGNPALVFVVVEP